MIGQEITHIFFIDGVLDGMGIRKKANRKRRKS
jgi:hypothetical protein